MNEDRPLSDSPREVGRNVARFIAVTFAVSAVFASLIIHTGTMATGRWLYVRGAMWSPAIATILLWPRNRPFGAIGWRWSGRYQGVGFIAAVGATTIVFAIAWLTGLAGFPNLPEVATITKDFGWEGLPVFVIIPAFALLTATIGLLPALPSALGEEIGWRGYLVPELSRVCSFTTTSVLSGVIWAAWHVPMILFADFARGVPVWYGLVCFSVFIIASSFICTWLRLKSRSIWPTVVLHAANNLMLQDVLSPLTVHTPISRFVIGEFGFLLPLLAIGGATVCWLRRGEVETAGAQIAAERRSGGRTARRRPVLVGSIRPAKPRAMEA